MLAPERKENVLGLVEIRQTFKISSVGTVAGCYVVEGLVRRSNAKVRLLRDNVVIHNGELDRSSASRTTSGSQVRVRVRPLAQEFR